jgi:hypothetical protein
MLELEPNVVAAYGVEVFCTLSIDHALDKAA